MTLIESKRCPKFGDLSVSVMGVSFMVLCCQGVSVWLEYRGNCA